MVVPPAVSSLMDSVDPGTVAYIVHSDGLRIEATNSGWDEFARENAGDNGVEPITQDWTRGASVLDAVAEPLRAFYAQGFATACESGERWEHDYECSSPGQFRKYRMVVYPFGEWLVVTHSLVVEHPHDRLAHPPSSHYTRNGIITMCAHCRRVAFAGARTLEGDDRWDWVPAYVQSTPHNVSHGLCRACFQYYYPE